MNKILKAKPEVAAVVWTLGYDGIDRLECTRVTDKSAWVIRESVNWSDKTINGYYVDLRRREGMFDSWESAAEYMRIGASLALSNAEASVRRCEDRVKKVAALITAGEPTASPMGPR